MFLWRLLRHLFTKSPSVNESDPCSIVMLLREYHFFTREELMEAGRAGFGKRFDGEEDPMFFVVQNGPITMLKAGPHAMHVLHQRRPYLGEKEETAKGFLLQSQRAAWLAHNGWSSIDMLNREISNSEAYATIARFSLHLLNDNCTAIWLPKHCILLTNDGQAEEWLLGFIQGKKTL